MSRVSLLNACLCFTLATTACEGDDDFGSYPPPGPGAPGTTGTLEFSWSIYGRQDAAACTEAGAAVFDSVIVDEGFVIGEVTVPCEDFETSVELYTDDFVARSGLVDASGFLVLGRIVQDQFIIGEDQVTRLVIDFPMAAVPMDPEPDAGAPPVADAGADAPPPDPDTTPPDAGAADAATTETP